MKRSVAITASMVALAGVLGLTGCGAGAASGSGEPVEQGQSKNSKAGKSDSIKPDEIEFAVEDGFWYDERKPVLTFTNNSAFDIVTVDVEFSQKSDMTDEQRQVVFADFLEDDFYKDDDLTEYVINSYKEQLVAPGETSLEAEVCLNNTGHTLENVEYFDLFEPSMAEVVYLGGDGRVYVEYIDYKTGKTKDASKGGKEAVMWSKGDLAKRMPKIDAPVRIVTTDDEDDFWFETLGVTIEDFDSYVKKLKEMGYDQIDYEDEDEFRAHDKDGYEATAAFSELNGAIRCHLDTTDVQVAGPESESSSAQVSADFKKTVDEYEKFFDEYVAFMAEYKNGGTSADMMARYGEYMTKYAEAMEALSNLEAGDLSAADMTYLLEAQGRITAKLANV